MRARAACPEPGHMLHRVLNATAHSTPRLPPPATLPRACIFGRGAAMRSHLCKQLLRRRRLCRLGGPGLHNDIAWRLLHQRRGGVADLHGAPARSGRCVATRRADSLPRCAGRATSRCQPASAGPSAVAAPAAAVRRLSSGACRASGSPGPRSGCPSLAGSPRGPSPAPPGPCLLPQNSACPCAGWRTTGRWMPAAAHRRCQQATPDVLITAGACRQVLSTLTLAWQVPWLPGTPTGASACKPAAGRQHLLRGAATAAAKEPPQEAAATARARPHQQHLAHGGLLCGRDRGCGGLGVGLVWQAVPRDHDYGACPGHRPSLRLQPGVGAAWRPCQQLLGQPDPSWVRWARRRCLGSCQKRGPTSRVPRRGRPGRWGPPRPASGSWPPATRRSSP